MDDRLIVTASPHIRDNATTRGLMGNVLIALVPSIVASGLIFWHACDPADRSDYPCLCCF